MATITVPITLRLVKDTLEGSDVDAIKQWIQTNIKEKLPENATCTVGHYSMQE